jgi:hypothetical protein
MESSRVSLVMSLNRALWGEVHPELRQASIEADETAKIVKLRFEYDGEPTELALESCSAAAAECIADFPEPWQLEEEHISRPFPKKLSSLQHLVYKRAERHMGKQSSRLTSP